MREYYMADVFLSQTPSRRPTRILARPSNPRTTFTFVFSVSLGRSETKHDYWTPLIPASERNGRKTLTTVQGLPKKFDQKKILKVIKKQFACNGTIVADTEMGEVIQLQGDQRKDVQAFLVDKKEGLALDAKTIKVGVLCGFGNVKPLMATSGPRFLGY